MKSLQRSGDSQVHMELLFLFNLKLTKHVKVFVVYIFVHDVYPFPAALPWCMRFIHDTYISC